MLDFRTMEPELRLPRKSIRKKVFIVQGDLDDKKLKEIPEVNSIIVTGNANFNGRYTYVKSELVVLGSCRANQLNVPMGLTVVGAYTAQVLNSVVGNVDLGTGTKIGYLYATGTVTIRA